MVISIRLHGNLRRASLGRTGHWACPGLTPGKSASLSCSDVLRAMKKLLTAKIGDTWGRRVSLTVSIAGMVVGA